MKWFVEKRPDGTRILGVIFAQYRKPEDQHMQMLVVAVALWFWAIGWKSEWRSK